MSFRIRLEKTTKPVGPKEPRPARQKWFSSYAYDTLAILGLGCSIMGLVSLGMELVMWAVVGQTPAGVMALPVAFVSMPLGMGAAGIAGMVFWAHKRLALLPALGALVYWMAAGSLWYYGGVT